VDNNIHKAENLVMKDSNWLSKTTVKTTAAVHRSFSDVVNSVVSKANQLHDRHMFHQHLLSTRASRDSVANSTGGFAVTRLGSVISVWKSSLMTGKRP